MLKICFKKVVSHICESLEGVVPPKFSGAAPLDLPTTSIRGTLLHSFTVTLTAERSEVILSFSCVKGILDDVKWFHNIVHNAANSF